MNSATSREQLVNSEFASDRLETLDEEAEPSTAVNVGTRVVSGINDKSWLVDSSTFRGETKSEITEGFKKRRLIKKSGELKVLAKNVPRKARLYLADIFTTMIDLRWKWVILIFVASYVISWTLFGFIWWLIAHLRGSTVCVWKVIISVKVLCFNLRTRSPEKRSWPPQSHPPYPVPSSSPSFIGSISAVLSCSVFPPREVTAGRVTTSFPGSLSPRPQEREKRDPGCGWSRDLGDKPKPRGGLFLNKILSTVSVIGRLINFFWRLHCIALRHDLNATYWSHVKKVFILVATLYALL